MWKSITKVSIGEHKFHLHPADKLNVPNLFYYLIRKIFEWSDIFTSQIFKLEKPKHESLHLKNFTDVIPM